MKNLIPQFIHDSYITGEMHGEFEAVSMFLDISGFTPMTERLMREGKEGAEVLSAILNDIFTPVIHAIYDRGGFISTFAGDAFTSVFPNVDNPMSVVYAAKLINKIFNEIGTQRTKYGDFELSVKLGLSSGIVNWGIIGSEKHKTYFLRGEAIDGCAYSEHHCSKMDIILDHLIHRRIGNKVETRSIDDGYFLLEEVNAKEGIIEPASISPMKDEVLRSFITYKVLESSQKGEFRNLVSVFISFKEPDSFNDLDRLTGTVIEETDGLDGYFNKIDFGDKGGVMLILFGAPVSHEDDIKRAVELIDNLKKGFGESIRAGLTFGIAYSGIVGSNMRCEYTALGDVINQSARFMMKAEWGSVWVSDMIYSKTQRLYNYNDLGEKTFKGKSQPIQVYELMDKTEYAETTLFEGEMVGRDDELVRLKEWAKPLDEGRFAGISYIYGDAGMGKSRLAFELTHDLRDHAETFLMQCDSILRKSMNPINYFMRNYFNQLSAHTDEERKDNFMMIYDMLLARLEMLDDERKNLLIQELRRTRSFLSALVGIYYEGSLYEQLEPKLRYENTLFAIRDLFRALSLFRPLIILIEDIQWLDTDSHKVFQTMTRSINDYPIMILATSRYNDDGTKPIINVDKSVKTNDMPVDKLTDDSVKHFIKVQFDGEVSNELVSFVNSKAENNPFYIEQICLYLKENNLILDQYGQKSITETQIEMPTDINAIIISRVDRLTIEIKEVIQLASVLGREVEVEILKSMIDLYKSILEGRDVSILFKQAEDEQIWSVLSELSYLFKHAMLREAVYEMQLRERLRRLHRLAAKSMVELYKDKDEKHIDIAYQYEKAEIFDKAKSYYEKAGDYFKKEYLNEEAIEVYDKLLALGINKAKRLDIIKKKADILDLTGRWNEAISFLEEGIILARDMGNKIKEGELTCSLGKLLINEGKTERAMGILSDIIELAREMNDMKLYSKAIGIMGMAHHKINDYDKAMEYYTERKKISKEIGDDEGYSAVLGNIGVLFSNKANFGKAKEYYDEFKKMCLKNNDRLGYSKAVYNIGILHWKKGEYEDAINCFNEMKKISLEIGNKEGYSQSLGPLGVINKTRGKYNIAMNYYKEQKNITLETGNKEGYITVLGNMGILYKTLGDYTKAETIYKEALQLSKEYGYKSEYSRHTGNLGNLYTEMGDFDKAIPCLEEKKKIDHEIGYKTGYSVAVGNIGIVHHEKKIYEKAMRYYDEAIEINIKQGTKIFICNFKYQKTKLLFEMGKIEKAKAVNDDNIELAVELKIPDLIFECSILRIKIDSTKNKSNAIKELEAILTEYEGDKEKVAKILYELWKLTGDISNRNKAKEMYQALYEKTPKYEYKKRIEEIDELMD